MQQFDKLFENGSDKEQTKKGYEALKAAYATMIAKAPSEIKDDLRTSAKAVESLFGLLEKYDYDFTKLIRRPGHLNVQKEL